MAIEVVVPELAQIVVRYPVFEEVADRLYMDARWRGERHDGAVAWVNYVAVRMSEGHTLVSATGDERWQFLQDTYSR